MKIAAVILLAVLSSPAVAVEAIPDNELEGTSGDAAVPLAPVTPSRTLGRCEHPVPRAPGKADTKDPTLRSLSVVNTRFAEQASVLTDLYLQHAQENPCLNGNLLLRITLDRAGNVKKVSAQPSNADIGKLAREVLPIVKEMNFGAAGNRDEEFEYELNFYTE